MNDLNLVYNNNGTLFDLSLNSNDYLRDKFQIQFSSANDVIDIGLYKPFDSIYVEIDTSTVPGNLSFLTNGNPLSVNDDTKSFSRSGFITFEKPVNWVKSTIDNKEMYWIQIDSSIDFDVNFSGINIVFNDDNDLLQEVRNINNLLAKGDKSFIAYSVASRNEIIQSLRNGGISKHVDDLVANITKWDLLELGEIRQASKYLTLSKIFFDISENVEDKFYSKFRDYQSMYAGAFKTFYLKIDRDDDGKYKQEIDLTDGSIEILRV